MTHLKKKTIENGIHYTLHGDYYFPDLEFPETSQQGVGRYGRMRKTYLEKHRPGLYERLILSGKLYEYLAEIDTCCADRMDRMIHQMADAEGISEEMKARDQLAWVGCMNSIRHGINLRIKRMPFDTEAHSFLCCYYPLANGPLYMMPGQTIQ